MSVCVIKAHLSIPCAGTKTEVRDGKLAVLKVNEGVY